MGGADGHPARDRRRRGVPGGLVGRCGYARVRRRDGGGAVLLLRLRPAFLRLRDLRFPVLPFPAVRDPPDRAVRPRLGVWRLEGRIWSSVRRRHPAGHRRANAGVAPGRGALGAVPVPTMDAVPTILVVDDEPRIVRLVRDYLEHGGFTVLVASDGPTALRTARTGRPDLVILDLALPGIDGLDVTRALRRDGEVPIIMLTARTEESDKLVGLELGADDYMTKPFSPKELVARVRAVLRRAEGMRRPADVIRVGTDVELDVPRMDVRIAGRRVDLTKTEFQILSTLARQPGRIFTRAQLLDA